MGSEDRVAGRAKVFELAPTEGLQLSLGLAAASLVIAVVCASAFGVGFLLVAGGTVPALFHLFSGAPKAIEVHSDRVVVRYALRRERTIPASELSLQRLPHEIVLVHGNDTLSFDVDVMRSRTLEACGKAIEAIARETIIRRQLRPRR